MDRKQKFETMAEPFRHMVLCWPFPNVLHKDIEEFSGGALSRSRLANILCEGDGPPTFRIFKKNATDLIDMAYWIYERTTQMNKEKKQ